MNILILNLISNNKQTTDLMTKEYENLYKDAKIEIMDLSKTIIKDCVGCWNCWVKTPGVCLHNDDMVDFYKKYLASDKAVFLFETSAGFLTGKVKSFIDRLIPLYHPYIEIHNGEMMHKYRYDKYPEIDFYFESSLLTEEETSVIEDYLYRVAYHFRVKTRRITIKNDFVNITNLEHREPKNEFLIPRLIDKKSGKVILYNGSPRGLKGNSLVLINEIIKGLKKEGLDDSDFEIRNLIDQKSHKLWAEDFENNNKHIFVFPLYVHSMPSIVMKFFELLKPVNQQDIQMSFIVQSGFSEAYQSYYLRPYLSLLVKRLNAIYGGTLIKGGIEGIQMRPPKSTENLFKDFQQLGGELIALGAISKELIEKLSSPVRLKKKTVLLFKAASFLGIVNFYWNLQLKRNNAYDLRSRKPYI